MARKSAPKTKPARPQPQPDLPKALKAALSDRKGGIDSEQLLNALIDRWGGAERFANDIYQEFQKAPPGGMTRQRILEMMTRLTVTNTTHEIGRVIRPADMSDDELEALAMGYLARVAGAPKSGPDPGPAPADTDAGFEWDEPLSDFEADDERRATALEAPAEG